MTQICLYDLSKPHLCLCQLRNVCLVTGIVDTGGKCQLHEVTLFYTKS